MRRSEYWDPQGTETNFNLVFPDSILAPLDRHKQKLLFLKGLSYKACSEKGYAGHDATAASLTGTKAGPSGASVPTGPSIDQVLADYLGKQPSGLTQLASLQIGLRSDGSTSGQAISHRPGGQRMASIVQPTELYNKLFANRPPDDPTAKARLISRRKSVLDFLSGNLTKLRGRLGKSQYEKLDAHTSALSDIENRLGIGASCSRPASPGKIDGLDDSISPTVVKLQCDLLAQAFACDITRVATFMIHSGGWGLPMPYINININPHDGLVHKVGTDSNPTTLPWRLMAATVMNWYAEMVSYLLDKLDAIIESDGTTVLDNTIVYWTSELGNPSQHDGYDVPMIIGGAKGIFRTGRFLTYGNGPASGKCNGPDYSHQTCPGMVPHNQLLVAIQNAFGIAGNTFGDPDYPGVLPNLT